MSKMTLSITMTFYRTSSDWALKENWPPPHLANHWYIELWRRQFFLWNDLFDTSSFCLIITYWSDSHHILSKNVLKRYFSFDKLTRIASEEAATWDENWFIFSYKWSMVVDVVFVIGKQDFGFIKSYREVVKSGIFGRKSIRLIHSSMKGKNYILDLPLLIQRTKKHTQR